MYSFSTRATHGLYLVVFLLILLATAASETTAQQKRTPVEPKRLAVDVVAVRGLGRLRGIILRQAADSVSIVVRRKWVEKAHPVFWKEYIEVEAKALEASRETLKRRIAQWRAEHDGDDGIVINELLDENEKLLGLDKPIDVSNFKYAIVTVEGDKKGRVYAQTEERHRLAGIGWSENIADVETLTATVLKRRIEKQKIDIPAYELTLGNEMPPMPDSDEEWEARKALVEFSLLSRLEYQGVGEAMIRRGDEADPLQALQGMLQGGGFSQIDQLGKDLGLPEFKDRRTKAQKNAWLTRIIRTAEKEGRRSFSVSRLTQGETVSVTTTLYFKALDSKWYPLKEFKSSQKLRDQTTEEVEQIMQDPQVARVVEMAKQFGAGGQGLLEKAMRSGVATKKALSKTTSELDEFVESYSYEIDFPPIER